MVHDELGHLSIEQRTVSAMRTIRIGLKQEPSRDLVNIKDQWEVLPHAWSGNPTSSVGLVFRSETNLPDAVLPMSRIHDHEGKDNRSPVHDPIDVGLESGSLKQRLPHPNHEGDRPREESDHSQDLKRGFHRFSLFLVMPLCAERPELICRYERF
jgi:hypothetical protein